MFERWTRRRATLGLPVFDPTAMYQMRGVPDAEIGLTVDGRSVAHRIVAGLQQQGSQHHVFIDDATDTERWVRVTSRTWATVAWPPRDAGTPMLTDVFEGLP